MALGQKIRINPNKRQQALLDECFGYARWAYNTGLATWKAEYAAGNKPYHRSVRDILKKSLPEWTNGMPKSIVDTACEHLRCCIWQILCQTSKVPEVQIKAFCKAEF